jgi:hypothetical protein
MKVSYDMASNVCGYGAEKASQTSGKPFTIPMEELADEKPVQTTKITQKFNSELEPIGYLTYVGYDKFDPFKEIAQTGSFKIPKLMQTKTMPTRSDEEILKDMEELAKEHARTGMSEQDDKRFAELMDEYISSVSPDRESVLRDKINEIRERIATEKYPEKIDREDKEKELIDFFIEMLGNKGNAKAIINSNIATRGNNIAPFGNTYNIIDSRSDGYYTQYDIDRGGGKVTSVTYDMYGALQSHWVMRGNMYYDVMINNGVVENVFFTDADGERIMSYNTNGGLLQAYTKAENERMQEITGVYREAYNALRSEIA